MPWWKTACVLVVLGLVARGTAGTAWAQEVDDASIASARAIGVEGINAYDAGRYEEALAKLDQAYQVVKAPTLGLWSARAMVKLGQLVAAAERYREVTRLEITIGDHRVLEQAKAEAAAELAELEPRIPTARIKLRGVKPSDVTVTIDGVQVPTALIGELRPVDPGPHVVEASRHGSVVAKEDFTVAEKESKSVVLNIRDEVQETAERPNEEDSSDNRPGDPQEDRQTQASTLRTAGIVALGVGGAGLVVGGAAGVWVLSLNGELSDDCPNRQCDPSRQDDVDRINRLRTISTIGWVVAGAGVIVGTTLVVTSRSSKRDVGVRVGPGALEVVGKF